MRARTNFGLLFFLLCVLNATAAPASLPGLWAGVWTRDRDSLPVTMTFQKTASDYTGSFDSDALQAVGVPLSSIRELDGKVHFEIKGDQSTPIYDGVLSGDSLSGTFFDGKSKGTFRLRRTKLAAARVSMREVTFNSGQAHIAGTLILPNSAGPHHAIAFLHGSGPEGRWANRYLAQKFAEAGIVALIYDKEGVGASTGDWRKAGFDALAADTVAAIEFLRAQPEVDAKRVGIYGHSQGGTIAPLVAARVGDLAFVIASAAPGIDLAEVEIYSVSNAIGIQRLPAAERADAEIYVRIVVDVAYHNADHARLDTAVAQFKTRPWYFEPPPPDSAYWFLARDTLQPSVYWAKVKAPVLLIYGEQDERVPARESIAAITAALNRAGNTAVAVKFYPDADHTFTMVAPVRQHGWPKHEPDYAATLVNWVKLQ